MLRGFSRTILYFLSKYSRENIGLDNDVNATASKPAHVLLQEIFERRNSLMRVVYVVSCVHATMSDLIEDLEKYGVIQHGHTKTTF